MEPEAAGARRRAAGGGLPEGGEGPEPRGAAGSRPERGDGAGVAPPLPVGDPRPPRGRGGGIVRRGPEPEDGGLAMAMAGSVGPAHPIRRKRFFLGGGGERGGRAEVPSARRCRRWDG